MAIEIRPFTPVDYEGLVVVENAAFPDYPSTADEWRYNDDHRDPTGWVGRRQPWGRWCHD